MAKEMDLQVQIENSKKEAERKQIFYKARTIAQYLGRMSSLDDNNGTEGRAYLFESKTKTLSIKYESGSVSGSDGAAGFYGLEINYKGNKVFHLGGGGMYAYIPGRWERQFNLLHTQAQAAKKEYLAKEKEKRETAETASDREERKKWGL